MSNPPTPVSSTRSAAIDLLRGVVMVLMVLDHARDFFFNARIDPADLKSTTPLLFLTRWVTHYCAPVFVLLAGTAAFLYGVRRSKGELTRFLVTRGFWLIFLELFVVHFGWFPDPYFHANLLQVIWALGCSMLVMAALCHLPVAVCLGFGVFLIVGHNLLDGIHSQQLGRWGVLWNFLHESHVFRPIPGHVVILGYPLVPWCGVMAVGYALGALMHRQPQRWPRYTKLLGGAAIILFVALRLLNSYGDPQPWSPQHSAAFTVISFLNCQKYPPSLLYLLMTLGPALLFLGSVRNAANHVVVSPLVTLGRAPLVFYVAHLFLLHYSALLLSFVLKGRAAFDTAQGDFFMSANLPLWTAYVAWLLAVLTLYPLCRWFVGVRARHPEKRWLSYL